MLISRFRKSISRHLIRCNSEHGSVESALVLIPLLALFLATLQLVATVNLRNVDLSASQSQASLQAVHQVVDPGDKLIELQSGNPFSRLRLLVVTKVREFPRIFPGISQLMGEKKLITNGVAVFEESGECFGGYLVC